MSMSSAIAFDTHHFVKQMVATGFTEEQAETQVLLLTEILGHQLSTKADITNLDVKVLELKRDIKDLDVKLETTKADLQRDIAIVDAKIETTKADLQRDIAIVDAKIETTKADLQRDIKDLDTKIETTKAELQRDLKELELRMVIKMGAMIIGGIGLIFGLMRAWPIPVQYVPAIQEMRAPPSGPGLPAPVR
ncbi:MAG: hypothetical protein HQM03_00295 [Magnetococcales bacterium]|nr:hypothetical protein [Magnetococcales bacterium]